MIMHSSRQKTFFQVESTKTRLEKVEKRVNDACRLTKRFKGFRVKAAIVKMWFDAQKCIKQNQTQEAIDILSQVEYGIKATLVGFYRFSPSFFVNSFNPFLYSLNGDSREKVHEALKRLSASAQEKWIDLDKAAEFYQDMNRILEEVKAEDPRRRTFSVRPFRPDKEQGEETEEEEYKIA